MKRKFSIERAERQGYEVTESGDYVECYTCNAPKPRILRKLGILAVGEMFGRAAREVLRIPKKLAEASGRNMSDPVEVEAFLRDVDRRRH